MRNYQIKICNICALIQFSFGMHCVLKGVCLPRIIDEYGISYTVSGLLLTAGTFGYIIGALISGIAGEHFGKNRVLSFVMLLLTLTAISVSTIRSLAAIILSIFLSGICYSIIESLSTDILNNNNIPVGHISLIFGMYCPGAAVVALLSGILVSGNYDWRICYFLSAIVCIVAFAVSVQLKNPEQQPQKTGRSSITAASLKAIFRNSVFVVGCFGMMLFSGVESATYSWFATFFTKSVKLTYLQSSLITVELYVSIFVGRYIQKKLDLKNDTKTMLIVLTLVSSIILVVISALKQTVAIAILMAVFGLTMSVVYPTLAVLVSGLDNSGYTYSLTFFFAGIGNLLMNSLMGKIADKVHLSGSVVFSAILLFLVSVLLTVIKNKLRHDNA